MADNGKRQFSKSEVFIGGVKAYLYNGVTLEEYVKKQGDVASKQRPSAEPFQIPLNVAYLVHGRGQTYQSTEGIAYKYLEQYYEKTNLEVPFVCVTFDDRNHGERVVDETRNRSWKSGNAHHGIDLVSMVHGIAYNLKLIIDYLPSYLNLEYFLPPGATDQQKVVFKYRNILSGVSLGGHTVIRFAHMYPQLVDVLNPIIGCSALSSLLINRLRGASLDLEDKYKSWFYYDYSELGLDEAARKELYPEAFHKSLAAEDASIFESFPFGKIKMFASFGQNDTLVPPAISKTWVDLFLNSNLHSEAFVQSDAGHEATPEMIDNFTTWLVKYINN